MSAAVQILPPNDSGAPLVDERSPWLGLASFTEETRAYFHGREAEVARQDEIEGIRGSRCRSVHCMALS